MIKFIRTFCLLLVFSILHANAQESVFHEDFSDGIPTTFSLFDRDGLIPKDGLGFPPNTAWAAWTDPDDNNNGIAASVSYYNNKGNANDWMVLPKIQMPEDSASCQLFWRSRSAFDTFKDGYTILVNEQTNYTPKQLINKGINWQFIRQVKNSQNPAFWTTFHADLSAYKGKEIYLAFINNTPDGWMLFLDDITVGSRESVTKAQLRLTSEPYAYETATVTGVLKAGILDTLTTFTARLTAAGDTISEEISLNKSLLPNAMTTLTLKNKLSAPPATIRDYKLELLDGDNVFAADSGKITFLASLDGKKVVVAEGLINRNDGYGPRLIEAYRKADKQFGDSFIGIQVHGPTTGEDDLTVSGQEDFRDYLLTMQGYDYGKGVTVDRSMSGEVYSSLNSLIYNRQSMPLLCTLDIVGSCDDDSIHAEASTVFALPLTDSNLRYEWNIVEDNVQSSQWNYYSGGMFGSFEGYENMELDVPVLFHGVLRNRLADANMTFDSSIAELDTVNVSLDVRRDFPVQDMRNLKAVFMVIDEHTGEIVNATKGALSYSPSSATGIDLKSPETSGTEYAVYDLTGTLISSAKEETQLTIPDKGIYIIKKIENGTIQIYKIRK